MALWLLFWVLLAFRLVRPSRHVTRAAMLLGLLVVAFAFSAWIKAHPSLYAVADRERVPVHYGTSEEETVRFELYEGDRVLVDRRQGGWARVSTADGERGWAKECNLVLVGPPYERPSDEPPHETTQHAGQA
ncbi:MAG TPA: SH3 domain-containing protein [Candidatus Hydrogenedentes bacterium]|nr:SH3 domain-containing protein [Candidatus Hydrogenedentota bacterium]